MRSRTGWCEILMSGKYSLLYLLSDLHRDFGKCYDTLDGLPGLLRYPGNALWYP